MKHIKPVTALAAVLFLAASLTICSSSYAADTQTLDTSSKASLAGAVGKPLGTGTTSDSSEEALPSDDYSGEYVMFGMGDKEMNFQNKKVVVDNEGEESGSITLNSDGTGIMVDGYSGEQEIITSWTVNDGSISIKSENVEFEGTINEGVIMIWFGSYSDTLYFALEGADASYSVVDFDEYELLCMAGTYLLTNKTGPEAMNRTQISWDVLNGLEAPSLILNEDGTGSLTDKTGSQDLTWEYDVIILDGEEYYLDLEGNVVTLDMYDYTMDFTWFGEEDVYLWLNWNDVSDEVQAEIPGSFYPLGESGLKFYIPASYVNYELTEEEIADDFVSNNVEEIDSDDDDYYDNDIYAYYYYMPEDDLEGAREWLELWQTWEGSVAWYPVTINGKDFLCWEGYDEADDTHSFWFCTFDDDGYETDIIYRTQHTLMNDDYKALVFKLAAGISS